MSQEIIEAMAGLARQLEEQLKFYREIGIQDIGDSLPAAKMAPEADSAVSLPPQAGGDLRAEAAALPVTENVPPAAPLAAGDAAQQPQTEPAEQESMPKKRDVPGQAGLFGDLLPPEDAPAAQSLPVIEAQDPSLEAIRADIGECTRCKLHEHRTHIVFGEGDPQARLVFVGARPFADKHELGLRVAFAKDDVGAVLVELTARAFADVFANGFKRRVL